jgi:hypothetical protein
MDFNTFKEKAKKYKIYKLILNEYRHQNICIKDNLDGGTLDCGRYISNIIFSFAWNNSIKGEFFWANKYEHIAEKERNEHI